MKLLAVALSACLLMFSGCCAPCGPCGVPVCGPPPLMPHLVNRMRCASGCGDFYLGEWHADPPCCDPCGQCGEYIGPVSRCKPTLRELWGIRYDECCDTGCSSCGHGHGHQAYEDEWVEDGQWHDDYYSAPVVPHGNMEMIPPGTLSPTPTADPPMPNPSDSSPAPSPMAEPPSPEPSTPESSMPEPAPPARSLDGSPMDPSSPPMQTMRGTYPRQSPFARTRRTRR